MSTWLDWKVILVTALVQIVGYGMYNLVGGTQFEEQSLAVYEQYQTDEGYDIFLVYYDDRDELGGVEQLLNEFREKYPNYEILDYQVVLKVRMDRVYEVLVIYARQKDGEE